MDSDSSTLTYNSVISSGSRHSPTTYVLADDVVVLSRCSSNFKYFSLTFTNSYGSIPLETREQSSGGDIKSVGLLPLKFHLTSSSFPNLGSSSQEHLKSKSKFPWLNPHFSYTVFKFAMSRGRGHCNAVLRSSWICWNGRCIVYLNRLIGYLDMIF